MANEKPLAVNDIYHRCRPELFKFESTSDIEPLERLIGQERALEAIEFGVDIQQPGFNLFVLGSAGLGKRRLVKEKLERRGQKESKPFDWCYINNFSNPQIPLVLKLPAGMGQQLRMDMEQFIEDLLTGLPASFESDEYRTELQEIQDKYKEQQQKEFAELDTRAEQFNIAIIRTPAGYTLAPRVDGKILDAKQFEKLPEEQQTLYKDNVDLLQQSLRELIQSIPLKQREQHREIKELEKNISRLSVNQLIHWLEDKYSEWPQVTDYLETVKENVVNSAQDFLPEDQNVEDGGLKRRVAEFTQYSVNVLVDNNETEGAPVVFENNPTFLNLIGRIEHIAQMGTLLTDFTLIKAGALHKANGGYLILDAHKLLIHPFAWEGLKRALSTRELKLESLEQMLSLVSTISLEPESIPLDIKIVLIGEPILYYLLKEYDPEFSLLFKVAADFSGETDRSEDNLQLYARLIAMLQQREGIRPLSPSGVARLIEQASRMADDGDKLSLKVETLSDLLHEANYWAEKSDSQLIGENELETAIEKRHHRHSRIHEAMQEMITRQIRLIDTSGKKIAQINGLSVIQLGDHLFGGPTRITATARLGRGNIIDIEREAKLGGHIHSKGVMILSSCLAQRYAREKPLPLAASLVFEQSYGPVDGDSASAAELCVLLSALGNIPIKQSFAVTGSINQHGEVQAIGGVNEKIEGFFEICNKRELDGSQGVIIPASNQPHLMLNRKVRSAVEEGKFSVYAVNHVDEMMSLLTGLPAGEIDQQGNYPKGSFNCIIQDKVEQLLSLQRQYARSARAQQPDEEQKDDD